MTEAGDRERIRRLKFWITGLTLVPSVALAGAGFTRAAAGYFVGGSVVLLNLLGTERSVLAIAGGGGRFLWVILYLVKLTLTAAVIAAVLIAGVVSPIALMLGIATLLMALVFDFLFFTRNIDEDLENREEP